VQWVVSQAGKRGKGIPGRSLKIQEKMARETNSVEKRKRRGKKSGQGGGPSRKVANC
jgi:hypothetical protein